MGGADTVRGISYQHAHAVLAALDVLADPDLAAIRVEGLHDVVDIELHDHAGHVRLGLQIKIRDDAYTWGRAELISVLRRWANLDDAQDARFQFLTDGRLGLTGETVEQALSNAAAGDFVAIAELMDLQVSDPACAVLARCEIRQEPTGVEPILYEAQREVLTFLDLGGVKADRDAAAASVVDHLYRFLSVRAGCADPAERLVTSEELLAIVGGTAAVLRSDRWSLPLAAEYVQAVPRPASDPVIPRLVPLPIAATEQQEAVEPDRLTIDGKCSLLAGPTGSGKSTTAELVRARAGAGGTAVVLVHAEAYVASRLPSLVAAGLSEVVGRDLPTSTGRQALVDPDVTIVIDGVSEIPHQTREALAAELRPHTASGVGARILLVGRDLLSLAAVVSTHAPVRRYLVKSFDQDAQLALAELVLAGGAVPPDDALRQTQHALGDAAGNPMLLTMALQQINDGQSFRDQVSLYAGAVEQMAVRTATPNVSIVSAALAVVFSGLLDEGRRYASPYEWSRRVAQACERLGEVGVTADPAIVIEAAERCGLISQLGSSQYLAPVHDSFADYLAGWALAEQLVGLRRPLERSDEQRLLFAAGVGGVETPLASACTEDLPFLGVRLSAHDRRACDPDELGEIVCRLLPEGADIGARLWHAGDRIVASLIPGEGTAWVGESEGRDLMRRWPTAVVEPPQGPLAVAVRVWRLFLRQQLSESRRGVGRPPPEAAADAAEAVAAHTAQTGEALERLVRGAFSTLEAEEVLRVVGPRGIEAVVHVSEYLEERGDYAIVYRPSTTVEVRVASAAEQQELEGGGWTTLLGQDRAGHTSVGVLLGRTPAAAAVAQVRKAVGELTGVQWL